MEAFLRFFRELGQTRLVALIGAGVLTLALIFYVTTRVTTSPMTPVYTDLSLDDSAKIVSELEKSGTPYELRANGTQVLVPSDQMLRLRLSLAQQGLPSGGSIVGYEIFDRSETMGTSSFVMNINMLRALEGELSRTISSLAQVESARVHLVVPKPELFSREKEEPTASIVLKLRGVSELNKEEVGAITHLVATAVPGLKPSKVTLVDSKGHMLSGTGEDNDTGAMASSADDYRTNYETRLKNKLQSLLEKTVGPEKVKVTVNADMNFDRVTTNSETYNPEGQVVRSTQEGEEKEQSTEKEGKDNTTVANNLPGAQANQTSSGSNRLTDKTDTTTNYEISKTVESHVQEPGKVNKLSIAVLVDGNYTTDKDGKETYAPRSDEERKQLATLVKSAMGYDEKRGDQVEIVNMRFSPGSEESASMSWMEWLKADMHSIIQTLAMLVVAILAFFIVIRPLVNRVLDGSMSVGGEGGMALATAGGGAIGGLAGAPGMAGGLGGGGGAALGGEGGTADEEPTVDLVRISGRVKSSTYNRLNELVDKHPDEALTVIRQWAAKKA